MLLQFKTENFKSFLDEMNFSMTPAPKQKDLEYSILEHKIGNKIYKGLCSVKDGCPFVKPIIIGSCRKNLIASIECVKPIVLA